MKNKKQIKLIKIGKDTLKQITKCTATLSAVLSLRHNLLFVLSDTNKTCLRADSETSNNSSDHFRKLIEALYKIQSIIKFNENLDAVHDCNIAIKDIIEHIKHLVRDVQQSKAKSYAFDKVDNNSAFCLCDFSQKIIPIKSCESQKEYFGKKGMTLDIDVFFYKLNDSIQKKFTWLQQHDVLLMFSCYYSHVAIMQMAAIDY